MRMEDTPYDAAMSRSKQELARQVVDANARIVELEAQLRADTDLFKRTDARIKTLEAALREIVDYSEPGLLIHTRAVRRIAREALAPEQDK